MAWWDDPQHRDAASYAIVSLFGTAVAATASLLRQWPRNTWVRALGTWMSNLITGLVVFGLGWEWAMPPPPAVQHPWPLAVASISAGWLGTQIIDKIAYRALGIPGLVSGMNGGGGGGHDDSAGSR